MVSILRVMCALTVVCFAALAQAVASACSILLPGTYGVGDTATDSPCTAYAIQEVINMATCPNNSIIITGEHTYTAQHLSIQGKRVALLGSNGTCGQAVSANTSAPSRNLLQARRRRQLAEMKQFRARSNLYAATFPIAKQANSVQVARARRNGPTIA